MTPVPSFRTDLYRGTAPFYDRYRPPYPDSLLSDLCRRVAHPRPGRLLDLACGTGQVAVPLSAYFDEVWALDQEEESVAFARAKSAAAGISNIHWLVGAAERTPIEGPFDLITIGTAFHRLDRRAVAERVSAWLEPGGAVALLWSDMAWGGDLEWQRALMGVFVKWVDKLEVNDLVPPGWEAAMAEESHAQVLSGAGFEYVGKFEFAVEQRWTTESLIGLMYSTALLNLRTLGDNREAFEQDLDEQIRPFCHEGTVQETASFAYELALKPSQS